ncbi:MAG: beta galactosidase jelly roll domain-containing protein [Phaeodactylibacter sp.]|nr:beta galactosidase jelly roll domain-containing protein [Phaeodactylibacter sp.]
MQWKGQLLLMLALALAVAVRGTATLPRLISDGMVLQRGMEVKVWGWAEAGERVSVAFLDSVYTTSARGSGEWEILLPPQKAGGPYTMKVSAGNTIIINDILIGEVWICSGQSNMELNMERARPLYEAEIASADNPYIRYFEAPKTYDFKAPRKDLSGGKWVSPNPERVLKFSAVAWFFARELYEKYGVPIGLVNTSLGGSPAEAWLSEQALKQFPAHYEEAQRFKDDALIAQIEAQDRARIGKWHSTQDSLDAGHSDPDGPWYRPGLNTAGWSEMNIPGYWAGEEIGPVNGVVWFRKTVQLPPSAAGLPARLLMGRIVDADSVFINGAFVGSTGYQYPPRRYEAPPGILKAGENVITVRVVNSAGRGGFVPDKPYELIIGGRTIDLKGPWKYRLGAEMPPLASQTFIRWKPLGLFNAMIAPLLNYRIRGVIWYQGESNAGRPAEYRELFPALIRDWRAKWGQGDFPFLFVQLANFLEARSQPSESNWALLREAQAQTLALPNTGMAVTIDIGEWNDIHPLNKKDVGKRLALAAQRVAYGEKGVVHSGPVFQSMEIDGNKVILSFRNTGSGLMAEGKGGLRHFAIAGADREFAWADARIEGDKVVAWSDQVPEPVAVRYAWADNPEGANLYNEEGLPASPFRTDEW